jgi:glycosyltransferase involved in cell wall biosynthesis
MNHCPTVSVVIPCFNDGRYLREALQSVFAQTLQPLEILVINDGSTDRGTVKILQSLDLPRVRVIHQENRGLAAARNAGIRNARGKYVYFLDADDVIGPACLATLMQLLENGNATAATSAVRICGGRQGGTVWGMPYNPYLVLASNQWSAGLMMRRDISKKTDLSYDNSMRHGYEDWEFNIRLGHGGHKILFSREPLYHYRIRKKSLLSTTRKLHVDVVTYIRSKHRDLYSANYLMQTKRLHAPGLRIICQKEQSASLEAWLVSQSYSDWAIDLFGHSGENERYRFYFANLDALHRLPPEALECALMALERYRESRRCIIAVRRMRTSLFSRSKAAPELDDHRNPIALITRNVGNNKMVMVDQALRECDLVIEFVDQNPSLREGWNRAQVKILPNALMTGDESLRSVRKNLRSMGKRILGDSFEDRCVRIYDHLYYGILRSQQAFAVRNKIRLKLGTHTEKAISHLVYGALLTDPPPEQDHNASAARRVLTDKLSPLFLKQQDGRIHVLIATNWLIEGGVEQIIFDICRLLDPARFRLTIVTTLPSHHSWDGLARKAGASVYHLADFLKPPDLAKGFLHFVFNQNIDCMFIMNSEAAYRNAKTVKQHAPWLPIIDRIEAADPGGGFPMISAKVGRDFIDLRTVSHEKLACNMSQQYHLRKSLPRVIYIGTNMNRIARCRTNESSLHTACNVNRETPIVLFLGRLARQKRPDVFVRTVARIFELNPCCNAHFAMLGDGELMEPVKTLISQYDLHDRLHLLGANPNGAMLLAQATLLMMPSAYEGIALVSYEAMALGVPQIFAHVGGQDELITLETGILIENGRGEETRYAEACLALLADPGRRTRMAAAGKERIRSQFTAEKAVNQYAEIFEHYAAVSRRRLAEIPHLTPPHINPLDDI